VRLTDIETTTRGAGHPAWSPDGARLAFVDTEYTQGRDTIWVIDSDGSGQRSLGEFQADYGIVLAWQPLP
jgi:Tol biopolymer transport system component